MASCRFLPLAEHQRPPLRLVDDQVQHHRLASADANDRVILGALKEALLHGDFQEVLAVRGRGGRQKSQGESHEAVSDGRRKTHQLRLPAISMLRTTLPTLPAPSTTWITRR